MQELDEDKIIETSKTMKKINYALGWIFVRPRRWFFRNMLLSWQIRWWFEKEWYGWNYPNIHWWILYHTVFRFFEWLRWTAWTYFCTYEKGWLRKKPLIAKIIHRIGKTTTGAVCHGGECYHCGSEDGCQVDLSHDETGTTFILEKTWEVGTQDGTDYRFLGTTICPNCGCKQDYEDGSL